MKRVWLTVSLLLTTIVIIAAMPITVFADTEIVETAETELRQEEQDLDSKETKIIWNSAGFSFDIDQQGQENLIGVFEENKPRENAFKKDNEGYLKVLSDLMEYAKEIENNDISKANKLVFEYMRNGLYDDLSWDLIAGRIDKAAVKQLQEKLNQIGFFRQRYVDCFGNELDIRHLTAAIDAIAYEQCNLTSKGIGLQPKEMDLAVSIVGDYASGIGNFYGIFQKTEQDYTFVNMKKLYEDSLEKGTMEDTFPNMSETDLLEDIDALNIAYALKTREGSSFYEIFIEYYSGDLTRGWADVMENYDGVTQAASNALNSVLLKMVLKKGAKDVLKEKFKREQYRKTVNRDFLESASQGFTGFMQDVYEKVRPNVRNVWNEDGYAESY